MELIKQSKLLKIKSNILSDLFNEKYGHKLGEFNYTTGTERVKGFSRITDFFQTRVFKGLMHLQGLFNACTVSVQHCRTYTRQAYTRTNYILRLSFWKVILRQELNA